MIAGVRYIAMPSAQLSRQVLLKFEGVLVDAARGLSAQLLKGDATPAIPSQYWASEASRRCCNTRRKDRV